MILMPHIIYGVAPCAASGKGLNPSHLLGKENEMQNHWQMQKKWHGIGEEENQHSHQPLLEDAIKRCWVLIPKTKGRTY